MPAEVGGEGLAVELREISEKLALRHLRQPGSPQCPASICCLVGEYLLFGSVYTQLPAATGLTCRYEGWDLLFESFDTI